MRLSTIEFLALLFTGVAGAASAVQAYVSWNTRDEVSRAIVFAQQIDACANMLASIAFVTDKADAETRAQVRAADRRALYRPEFFFGPEAMRSGVGQAHRPLVARFEVAASTFKIVMPEELEPTVVFFERVVRREVTSGGGVAPAAFAEYLAEIDRNAQVLVTACRRVA
ncbi:MAG: hypothetical protein AAFR16_14090 [Pseudomonadota bacterium]